MYFAGYLGKELQLKLAAKGRNIVSKKLTKEDLAKAQQMAREWFDKYQAKQKQP